jgi:hypothetical protein
MFAEIEKPGFALDLAPKKSQGFWMKIGLCGIQKFVIFWMLGFFGVSFVMHVHVFSIITSHSFF